MKQSKRELKASLMLLGSVTALATALPAYGQAVVEDEEGDVIVVKGIRKSLETSSAIKRESRGVVDAITAEDMGKFPDTNLAESLQRISGVSISRSLGEGSQVTVRGFGPDFNLVLLNGRQMPSAYLTGGAPSSRSFDFGNLASEGIAGVNVYKTGRAAIPTGGIGSTLNILTARPLDAPGLRYSVGAKAVVDNSVTSIGDDEITPEYSGIWSNTFYDNTIGVTVAGSYQKRVSGLAQAATSSGWRGAYLGSENNWGTLPQPPGDTQVTNRPGDTDIYSVPQNMNYQLANFERERVNGQVALQFRPVDNFTATLDYFYSENNVQAEKSDMSVWFNHGNTTSAWGDGPISDILFYNEDFGDGGSDLSMGAVRDGSRSENNSFGFNAEWDVTDRLSLELDIHSSSAASGEDSPYGTSSVISTADFALRSQGVNFQNELPTLSLGFQSPFTDISADRHVLTGSVFSNSYIKTEIDQAQLFGSYDIDSEIVRSVDFGVAQTKNKVRSAFANVQRDSWGGVGSAADLPDDIFTRVNLAENFDQFSGYNDTFQDFFAIDFDRLLATVDDPNWAPNADANNGISAICGGDGLCRSDDFTTDRRIEEDSFAAFVDVNFDFTVGTAPARLTTGVRYEKTEVESNTLVPAPTGTAWVADNELILLGVDAADGPVNNTFFNSEGDYEYWLPAVDFEIDPVQDVKLRASYSKTMTRPGYADLAGGVFVNKLFRVNGGEGTSGNTDLDPFLSTNIDLSAEWYYDEGSYVSVGYFNKKVDNFISTEVVRQSPYDIATPIDGARYAQAVAAVGNDLGLIRQWIVDNTPTPSSWEFRNGGNWIYGDPSEDPTLGFNISRPFNDREQKLDGWEFTVQHLFGETGFGAIANYTIVDGDVEFDDLQPASGTPQTALLGLSDSYNLIGFFDKNGLQARLAYNWRDQYLNSVIGVSGAPNNPLYVEEYGQFDFNASYEVKEGLTVFVEGINITDETSRTVGRSDAYVNFAVQTGSRYNFGIRFNH